jgi:hypothetical protein
MKKEKIIHKKNLLLPRSVKLLEQKVGWRLFKALYFILGSTISFFYGLMDNKSYSGCPLPDPNIPWEKARLLCDNIHLGWFEAIGLLILTYIILRILLVLIEKVILYVIGGNLD